MFLLFEQKNMDVIIMVVKVVLGGVPRAVPWREEEVPTVPHGQRPSAHSRNERYQSKYSPFIRFSDWIASAAMT